MKKYLVIILTLVCMLALVGCNTPQTSDTTVTTETTAATEATRNINDYLTVDQGGRGKQWLRLPISGRLVEVHGKHLPFIKNIDVDLLEEAEQRINSGISKYSQRPNFHLELRGQELYLYVEIIVDIDPTESPDGLDHEHVIFMEKITK
jgi:hypothetical protein